MRAIVEDTCVGCGLCVDTCPEVFEMGAEDIAIVIGDEVPEAAEATCKEAVDACPVEAIKVEE